MRAHRYRVTLEHLETPRLDAPRHEEPLHFETSNHDDVFAIVERIRASGRFDPDTAASMAVGLKLFTEVMLQHRKDPLFAPLEGPMREFIGALKAQRPG